LNPADIDFNFHEKKATDTISKGLIFGVPNTASAGNGELDSDEDVFPDDPLAGLGIDGTKKQAGKVLLV
jgi:hypothetical protein